MPIVLLSLIPLLFVAYGCDKNKMALGQEQLTQMLNAAWVRVLSDGTYRSIIENEGVTDVITNFAGCLPAPEYAPFPNIDDLACNAKKIINETQVIRFGRVPGSPVSLAGIETSQLSYTNIRSSEMCTVNYSYFAGTIDAIRDAVIAQVNLNYDIELEVHMVNMLPFQDFTELLNDGTIDVLDQVNALGGSDDSDLLRRYTRLFSCSMIASGQYAIVSTESPINSMEDIRALGEDGQLCTSYLSSGFTSSYFPEANKTRVLPPPFEGGDIATCFPGVYSHHFDAYISIFHTVEASQYDFVQNGLSPDDFRVVDLSVIAATPYWVAKDLET